MFVADINFEFVFCVDTDLESRGCCSNYFTDLESSDAIAVLLVVEPLPTVLETVRTFRDAVATSLIISPFSVVGLVDCRVHCCGVLPFMYFFFKSMLYLMRMLQNSDN